MVLPLPLPLSLCRSYYQTYHNAFRLRSGCGPSFLSPFPVGLSLPCLAYLRTRSCDPRSLHAPFGFFGALMTTVTRRDESITMCGCVGVITVYMLRIRCALNNRVVCCVKSVTFALEILCCLSKFFKNYWISPWRSSGRNNDFVCALALFNQKAFKSSNVGPKFSAPMIYPSFLGSLVS